MLIPALAAFLIDLFNQNKSNSSFIIKPFEPKKNLSKDIIALITSALISFLAIMPIIAFVMFAFIKKYPTDMTLT